MGAVLVQQHLVVHVQHIPVGGIGNGLPKVDMLYIIQGAINGFTTGAAVELPAGTVGGGVPERRGSK